MTGSLAVGLVGAMTLAALSFSSATGPADNDVSVSGSQVIVVDGQVRSAQSTTGEFGCDVVAGGAAEHPGLEVLVFTMHRMVCAVSTAPFDVGRLTLLRTGPWLPLMHF